MRRKCDKSSPASDAVETNLNQIHTFSMLKPCFSKTPSSNMASLFKYRISLVTSSRPLYVMKLNGSDLCPSTLLFPCHLPFHLFPVRSTGYVLGVVTRVGAWYPRNRDLMPGRGKILSASPQGPDRFWSPLSLIFNGQRRCLLDGTATEAWSWTLISNYCRSWEWEELYLHSPICLRSV